MSTTLVSADQLLHDAEEGRAPARTFTASQPTPFEWFFVITGGLALFLPLVWWIGEDELNANERIQWYFWASALISSPHVYSTYVRQYRKSREGKMGSAACMAGRNRWTHSTDDSVGGLTISASPG